VLAEQIQITLIKEFDKKIIKKNLN